MIEIVGLAIISNLFTHWFEPIQSIKSKILSKLNINWITTILTCPKCFGLYTGIIYALIMGIQHNFLMFGAMVSFVSYIIKFIIDKVEYEYQS
jgi:hypothetical protein